jgi:hypothetical protein
MAGFYFFSQNLTTSKLNPGEKFNWKLESSRNLSFLEISVN